MILNDGGEESPKGIPANDSLSRLLFDRPRNRRRKFTELHQGLCARRKFRLSDDRGRGKRGRKGGENGVQKIVLVKYDDLHLSRYKEILWPPSRGFPSPSALNYFQRTIKDRYWRPRVRRFFFIFNFSILFGSSLSFFFLPPPLLLLFLNIYFPIRDSKSRSIDSNGPSRFIFRRAQQTKKTLADSRGFNFPPVIAIYNKTRAL